ncbi:carbohydrate kinase family protein [Cohnella sp.]|uniref:carbohydrate kinase family protein n=1 Tax=Cohnella sp. TaxID=1883426 RepID=UPI0035686DDB
MLEWDRPLVLREGQNDVVTVGELLVDLISAEYGDTHESEAYHKYFGGSPANIAMNVRKLGGQSQLVAAVGNDGLGQYLLRQLRKGDIDPLFVETVDQATSLVLLTKSRSTPVPIFYRSADYQIGFGPKQEQLLRQSKLLHFSCWPVSRTPARTAIESMIAAAKSHGVRIGFDPNYHPMLWPKDEDGTSFVKSLIGMADIVKPSDDDAERLFGPDSPENQVEKFLGLGAGLVILTMGKEGALVSNGTEIVRFPTLASEVADTTGAGDAFWSGFYTGLIKEHTLREAISLGFAVSAYKLKFTGAVVDLPALDKIRALYGL